MKKRLMGLILALAMLLTAVGQAAELTVQIFTDANNNGELGRYEEGIAGVTVTLLQDGQEVDVAESDDSGVLHFSGVADGDYSLRCLLPEGYGFTKAGSKDIPAASVTEESSDREQESRVITVSGEDKTVSVGIRRLGALEGKVWLDESAEGIMDEGEPGVSGVLVEMVGTKNGLTYQTYTDENGDYSFTTLKPGNYRLRVTVPEGMGFTRYSATGGARRSVIVAEGKAVASVEVEIKGGKTVEKQYVGLISGASISGVCFLDANYNGLYDEGEELFSGTTLELSRGKNTLAKVTVDETGSFSFSGLRSGTYTLQAILPKTGVSYTVKADGGNAFKNLIGRRECTLEGITLETDEHGTVLLGAFMPGTVTGTAYIDKDFSATHNGKEQVVSGLSVSLLNEEGEVVDTARTNGKGKYTFENLTPGIYSIKANAKKGYAFTKLGEGNIMVNDSAGLGHSDPFEYVMGEDLTGMDLGMILPGTVKGVFFADANDNGLQDSDEGGLVGTQVRLVSDEGVHFSAEIGEDGAYCFDAVMPGTYWLEFTLPENGVAARQASGGNQLDDTWKTETFSFSEGDKYTAPLCGGLLLGEISGTAFADPDGSGTMDAGETALAGAELTLTPSRSDLEEQTVTTGEDGSFRFSELRPDTYTLRVVCPEDRVTSHMTEVTLPLNPGKQDQRAEIDLTMGSSWTDQQLGMVLPVTVSGRAWLDENDNGLLDEGEAAPTGIEITMTDEATGEAYATARASGDGSFTFEGLLPGSWTASVETTDTLLGARSGDSTFHLEGSTLKQNGLTYAEGDTDDSLRLGLVRLNSISGTIYADVGGSLEPLADVQVHLDGAARDGAVTGEDGTYCFKGLMPGEYTVSVELPEGWLVMEPEDDRVLNGTVNSTMAQAEGNKGSSAAISLTMLASVDNMDVVGVQPGKLGDRAWLDENGNGLQDYDEMGLAGVTVRLKRNGETVQEVVTDQYGYWLMKDVYPAVYTLEVEAPDQVKATTPTDKYPGIVSVLLDDGSMTSGEITVESGKSNFAADLGFALKEDGQYPEGYGEAQGQIWQ